MISMPPGIQTQLGEAVSAIADSDFWERWDTLVDVSSPFFFFAQSYIYIYMKNPPELTLSVGFGFKTFPG